jgi:hypothetical protein
LVGTVDWRLLCDVMGYPEDEAVLRRRTVSCTELAGRSIDPEAFACALTQSIDNAFA